MRSKICLFFLMLSVVHSESWTSVKINGRDTVLSLAERKSEENDVFMVEDEEFSISSAWALFGLKDNGEYNIKTWEIAGNCGCSNQICGRDCVGVKGVDCDSNSFDAPLTCMVSSRRGFCWGFVETESSRNYTVYNLSLIGIVALTSYPGPAASYVSPGFTIRKQYEGETYSLNAMITEFTPRRQRSLSKYVYAESEGRIISIEDFSQLTSKPELTKDTVNIEESTCPEGGHPAFKSTKITTPAARQVGFRSYSILRRGTTERLAGLDNRYILTPRGVLKWGSKQEETFDIFDPCNQQFLTLQRDELTNNFFVHLPATQRLMKDDLICVAINDIDANIYDLVLYEVKNGSAILETSDRFRGFVSQDYINSVQLSMTTKSNIPIQVPTGSVEVSFAVENDLILKLLTSSALSCEIFVSPTCHFRLSTSQEHLLVTKVIGENTCGYLYEVGHFLCEGIAGNFYPPSIYVEAEKTFSTKTISALNIPQNESWTPNWYLTMLVALVIIMMIFYLFRRKTKQTGFIRLTDESEPLNEDETVGKVLTEDSDDDEVYPDHKAILQREWEIQKRTKVCVDKYFNIWE